mgnify:FL=1
MLKEAIEGNTVFKNAYRIYTSDIGPRHMVVVEWEYKDLQEMRFVWDTWLAKSSTPEFLEKWNKMVEGGGNREVWDLTEQR